MELIFIRHGEGEHTLHTPESLQLRDPHLTKRGISQAYNLPYQFPLTKDDVLIASPTRRTLQTASIWSENIDCHKLTTPLVSPRMFPQNQGFSDLPCDKILSRASIQKDFPMISLDESVPDELWRTGINRMAEETFQPFAHRFIDYCKSQNRNRIFIVSHDGTITSYRQLISGQVLSRNDFPKETGWYKQKI